MNYQMKERKKCERKSIAKKKKKRNGCSMKKVKKRS